MLGSSAALSAIRAAFGEPVRYVHVTGAQPIDPLSVIWSDVAGDAFQGPGNTTRTVTAEIEVGAVPGRPDKRTRLTRAAVEWKVIEVVDREDVNAWVVTLERA